MNINTMISIISNILVSQGSIFEIQNMSGTGNQSRCLGGNS